MGLFSKKNQVADEKEALVQKYSPTIDLKQRKIHQQYRKKPGQPLLTDWVEDGVRSRGLSVATLCLLITLVMHIVLNGAITDPTPLWGDDTADSVQFVLSPPRFVEIDTPFVVSPIIQVNNFVDFGLEGHTVTAEISEVHPTEDGICNIVDGSLEATRGQLACQTPTILNNVATTDARGFATFQGMAISSLIPALMHIKFTSGGRSVTAEVNVESPIRFVTVSEGSDFTVAVNEEFPQISINAKSILLEDLPNRSCYPYMRSLGANNVARDAATGAPVQGFVPSSKSDKLAILEGASVVKTDQNGTAVFTGLKFTAANDEYQYLHISCEGTYALTVIQITLTTSVSQITDIEEKSTTVVEGRPFPHQPTLKVVDSSGNGVANVICFASVHTKDGVEKVFSLLTTALTGEDSDSTAAEVGIPKETINVLSNPSGADGTVTWESLGFSLYGTPGKFHLSYNCEGVESGKGSEITVSSAVKFVEVKWDPSADIIVPRRFKDLPTVLALNSAGAGVEGKKLEKVEMKFGANSVVTINPTDYAASLSNANGEIVFTFFRAPTLDAVQETRFVFTVQGVTSKDSQSMTLIPFFAFDPSRSNSDTNKRRRNMAVTFQRRRLEARAMQDVDDFTDPDAVLDIDGVVSDLDSILSDLDSFVSSDLDSVTSDLDDFLSDIDDFTDALNDLDEFVTSGDLDDFSDLSDFSDDFSDFSDDFSDDGFSDGFIDDFSDDIYYDPSTEWCICADGQLNPWEDFGYDDFSFRRARQRFLLRNTHLPESTQRRVLRMIDDQRDKEVARRRQMRQINKTARLLQTEYSDRWLQDSDGTDIDGTDLDGIISDLDGVVASDVDGLTTSDFDSVTSDFDSVTSDFDSFGDITTDLDSFTSDLDGLTTDVDGTFDLDDIIFGSADLGDIDDFNDLLTDFSSDDFSFTTDFDDFVFPDEIDDDFEDDFVSDIEAPEDWIEGTCPCDLVATYEPEFSFDVDDSFYDNEDFFFEDESDFDTTLDVDIGSLSFPSAQDIKIWTPLCAQLAVPPDTVVDIGDECDGLSGDELEACEDCVTCGSIWECSWCLDDGEAGCVVRDNFDACWDFLDPSWEEYPAWCNVDTKEAELAEMEADLAAYAAIEENFNDPSSQVELQAQYADLCTIDENGHFVGGDAVSENGMCDAYLAGELKFYDGDVDNDCHALTVVSWTGDPIIMHNATGAATAKVQAFDSRGKALMDVEVCAAIVAGESFFPQGQDNTIGCATTGEDGIATLEDFDITAGATESALVKFRFYGTTADSELVCKSEIAAYDVINNIGGLSFEEEMDTSGTLLANTALPFKVKVVSPDGAAVSGTEVTATLVQMPDFVTAIVEDGDGDADATVLSGYQATTGTDGVADFDNFMINKGFFGDFAVQIVVTGFQGRRPLLASFTLPSPVTGITVEQEAGNGENGTVSLGSAFETQPQVKVNVNSGDLDNYRVFAGLIVDGAVDLSFLSNYISGPSGADGVATFSGLAFASAAVSEYKLTYFVGDPSTVVSGRRRLEAVLPYEHTLRPRGRQLLSTIGIGAKIALSQAESEIAEAVESLTVMTRIRVEITTQPPKTATFGTPLSGPIACQVFDGNGDPLSGLSVQVNIEDHPIGGKVVVRESTSTARTGADGVATFNGIIFDGSAEGDYTLSFSTNGGKSADTNTLRVSFNLAALSIQEKTTIPVDLGEAFKLTVKGVDPSDNPIRRVPIRLKFKDNPGNGVLLASRAIQTTDDEGVAKFDVVMTAGLSGDYKLVAVFGNVTSNSSPVLRLSNEVAKVVVVKQLNKAVVEKARSTSIEKTDQAELLILDDRDIPVRGKKVSIKFSAQNKNFRPAWNPFLASDKNGVFKFEDLYFRDGLSGTYQVWFNVDGVESEKMEFEITNKIRPNLSNLGLFKVLIYVFVLLMLPFMWANSAWEVSWAVYIGLATAFIYLGTFLGMTISEVMDKGELDSFDICLKVIVFVNIAAIIAFSVMSILAHLKRETQPETFYHAKHHMAQQVVRALFQKFQVPSRKIIIEEMPDDLTLKEKIKWKLASRKRNKPKPEIWDKPYQEKVDKYFLYSTRYTTTAWISFLYGLYVFLAFISIVLWLKFNLRTEFQSITDFQAEYYRDAEVLARNADALAIVVGGELIPGGGFLNDLQKTILTDATHFLDSLAASGIIAIILASVLIAGVFKFMMANYKRTVMDIRQGRLKVDRSQFPIKFAGQHTGLQAGATALAIVGMIIPVWLVLFCLIFTPIREFIISTALTVVVAVLGTSLIQVFATILATLYCIQAKIHIRNRRAFAIFDVFTTVLALLGGPLKSLVRWIVGAVLWNVAFARNDVTIEILGPKDAGFRSWMSQLLIDADYNNPVATVFAQILIEGSERRKQEFADREEKTFTEEERRKNRIRNKWQMAYLMVRHPAVAKERKKVVEVVVGTDELKAQVAQKSGSPVPQAFGGGGDIPQTPDHGPTSPQSVASLENELENELADIEKEETM